MCHFCSKSDTDEYSKARYRHGQYVVAPFYKRERKGHSHHHLVPQQESQESKLLTRWSAREKKKKKRKLKLCTSRVFKCWHTNHHGALPSRSLIAIQLWQLHQLFKNNEVFQLTFNAI